MTLVIQGFTQFLPAPNTSHTSLYSRGTEHYRPFFGSHCAHLQRDGQAELTWWLLVRVKFPTLGVEARYDHPSL